MKNILISVAKAPIIGHIILLGFRFSIGVRHVSRPLREFTCWLFHSKETTNFTYDLEVSNKKYLAWLIADVANIEFGTALRYILEIESDTVLRKHIATTVEGSEWSFLADKEVRFSRRVGWYALARAVKPRTIVETGVDKGLGACVLTAALKRNSEEGFEGEYFGTDINPKAGYLLSGEYAKFGTIIYGDSVQTLQKFDHTIDIFINDSDHSAEYEAQEYQVIASKLSKRSFILGDNSHSTDKLFEFSIQASRNFIFFPERPLNHWHPGAGIGISYIR